MKQVYTLFTAFFIFFSSLYAQPGTVDSSFGVNGIVIRNDLQGAYQRVHSRYNGKILVTRFADTTAYITEYSNSGLPEKTIHLASVDVQGPYRIKKGTFHIIEANKDGKIFVVGDMLDLDQTTVFIARFNRDGSPDSSFATNGVVQYAAGNFPGSLRLIIQPDNKLLLSVLEIYDAVPTIETAVLLRYLPNGTPDSSFGVYGRVRNIAKHTSMQLQHNGKIVLGYGYQNIQLSRRNADGSLDSSFGQNGTTVVIPPYPINSDDVFRLSQMIIQPDDKIIATGGTLGGNNNYTICTRFNATGTLDNSFADEGFISTPIKANKLIQSTAVALQADGKILIGGRLAVYFPITPDSSVLLRLHRNGSLDRSFGNGGYVKNAAAKGFTIYDIAVQQDGKILTCGYQVEYNPNGTFLADHPSIARYNGDAVSTAITKADAATKRQGGSVMNVYPNPVTDILHIFSKRNTTMFLVSSSGKAVWTGKVNGSTAINVSQFPAGVYFLSSPGQAVQKVVIRH